MILPRRGGDALPFAFWGSRGPETKPHEGHTRRGGCRPASPHTDTEGRAKCSPAGRRNPYVERCAMAKRRWFRECEDCSIVKSQAVPSAVLTRRRKITWSYQSTQEKAPDEIENKKNSQKNRNRGNFLNLIKNIQKKTLPLKVTLKGWTLSLWLRTSKLFQTVPGVLTNAIQRERKST